MQNLPHRLKGEHGQIANNPLQTRTVAKGTQREVAKTMNAFVAVIRHIAAIVAI